MFQACILSSHEGTLNSDQRVYLTFMGGTELRAPTLARQVVSKLERSGRGITEPVKQVFVTILGATEIHLPTLTEEFIDFRDMVHSGKLAMTDWDRLAVDGNRADVSMLTFTALAGFEEGGPPEDDEEIDAIALQRHLGNISEEVAEILKAGIGQRGAERRATLRRAITALNGPATTSL